MQHGRLTKSGGRRVAVLFLAMACLLMASIGLMYWTGLIALEANRRLDNQRDVIEELGRVVSTLRDAETGQRGYLLTGDQGYLQPYNDALHGLRTELDKLAKLVSSGDLPAKPVAKVLDLTEKKLAELEETIKLRRDRGLEAALTIVRSGQGKQFMDDICGEVARMKAGEEVEFHEAARRLEQATTLRTGMFAGVGLLNLIFLSWAYGRLSGEIDQRSTAVLESERQKELVTTTLASIGDGVIVTDEQGRITFLNGEAERLTGWNSREAQGLPLPEVFRIFNEQTRQPVENPVEKVLRLGTVVGLANHTVLVAKDGRETPIDDSGAPVRKGNGPVQGVVLVFRDITAQKQAQATTERLAAIVESSDDAIVSKTLEGIIQTWNAGAERMLGYGAEEMIGKPITILLPPERIEEESHLLERIGRGERLEHYETVRVAKNGRHIEVWLALSPLKDAEGKVIGASTIARDISERKRVEEQLERLVTERTASLQETTDQLNSFVYTVAHDLRAPLRAQHGYSGVLLEDFGEVLGETGRDYVHRIAAAAERLDALVSDLLGYASISREKLVLSRVPLSNVVAQAQRDLADVIQGRQATVGLGDIQEIVQAHEGSLQLIVNNLLSNALKFVKPGQAPKVRLWTERRGEWARLWVEDEGIGIPSQFHEKLFGVFQRLHSSQEYPGTGIGLAMVKRGVERMGGKVGVESEAGKGSRFWIELKLVT